jgi:hypothetical protein
VLALPKALHNLLQFLVRSYFPGPLDIACKAFAEQLGPAFHFDAQALLLCYHLKVGKGERNERYPHNQGDDEPNTQQSHGEKPPAAVPGKSGEDEANAPALVGL